MDERGTEKQPMQLSPPLHKDEDVDLIEIFRDIWKNKAILAVFMVAFFVIGIVYLNLATYKYSAQLIVAPAQNGDASSSRLGSLRGLASIAGLSLPQDSGASAFLLYTEAVHSWDAANDLAKQPELMQHIFASEWDERTKRFSEPTNIPLAIANGIKSVLGIPVFPWQEPDASRLQAYIQQNVTVEQDAKTSIATISFEHKDPDFAVLFLRKLHLSLDNRLRQQALARSKDYIRYLTRKIETVTIAEHRSAVAQALSDQEKIVMTASSNLAYAASPIDSISVSLQPTSPRPVLVLAMSLALGLMAGALTCLIKERIKQRLPGDRAMGNTD